MIAGNDARQLGKMLMRGALSEIAVTAAIWLAVVIALNWLTTSRDDSDPPSGARSGLQPRTDHLTGCQYLETKGGGITPRTDRNGRQICK